MDELTQRPPDTITKLAGALFERIEHVFYLVLGVLLCLTAALACVSAFVLLAGSFVDFHETTALVELTDRLLFVLMLVEILHTVQVSLRTGTLRPEPFLVVGLIASIRRVLVITLESSQVAKAKDWTDQTEALFRATMIELAVLGVLILILVASLFMIRASNHKHSGANADGSSAAPSQA